MRARSSLSTFRTHVWRSGLTVFFVAVIARLVFAGLTARTFDPDEFVFLALSGSLAHGAALYRTIIYFHPPGLLVLFAALHPLVAWWWPSGRVVTLLIDSLTAVFVWRIGREIMGPDGALAAGLVYAVSPIALLSAVRIGPDPIVTALGTLGIMMLLTVRNPIGPIGAGICLALAVWTKYTGVLFLPICLLVAPGRIRAFVLSWAVALGCLFSPYLRDLPALYSQTVVWQLEARPHADLLRRAASTGAYWLLLNPLAAIGMWRVKAPMWARAGFCLGLVYLFSAEAYFHYFAMVVPFAALLTAPVIVALKDHRRWLAAAAALAVLLWGIDVGFGSLPARMFVTSSKLSQAGRTALLLDRATPAHSSILTDQFEYALLAHRTPGSDYFWNMRTLVSARALERDLPRLAAVVETRSGRPYPNGFIDYLDDRHYPRRRTGDAVVWLTRGRG